MFMGCDDVFAQIVDGGQIIPLVAIVLGCFTGMVGIVFGSVSGIAKTRAREQTRRDLGAYVAEGSIRPEDAVAMLNAGRSLEEKVSC
jgi:hypothetical protein